jgi:hypothetical protein
MPEGTEREKDHIGYAVLREDLSHELNTATAGAEDSRFRSQPERLELQGKALHCFAAGGTAALC